MLETAATCRTQAHGPMKTVGFSDRESCFVYFCRRKVYFTAKWNLKIVAKNISPVSQSKENALLTIRMQSFKISVVCTSGNVFEKI